MLITRRRVGEAILIGDGIEIQIIEIGPQTVKLGIQAPREIPVCRKEAKVTRDENLTAAASFSPEKLSTLAARLKPASETSKNALPVHPLRWLPD